MCWTNDTEILDSEVYARERRDYSNIVSGETETFITEANMIEFPVVVCLYEPLNGDVNLQN